MKRQLPIIAILAAFSIISGYMIHKMSWLAKVGIRWVYREYDIFKSWPKTSLMEFVVLMLLLAVHNAIFKYATVRNATISFIASVIIALFGLYYTYNDFRHELSHRLAGERFHIGFYLFWLGWIIIGLYSLARKRGNTTIA
ncbi:MAG: hypothetical protein BGO70_12580 [Bacteroidetes bacterium 43-93]|nr:hypothetical protein [Bacteroidota bacterium]OJW98290.1 MAG: hypothetical protein BGO70_12580 [Bacteroidetes bacterium 43-93]